MTIRATMKLDVFPLKSFWASEQDAPFHAVLFVGSLLLGVVVAITICTQKIMNKYAQF
jgi:hypothetical protein